MHLKHFFVEGIAHSSYLLGGDRNCAIIDPSRDPGAYIEAATRLGLRITHVLVTHLHADFISGHMDIAEATGARIHAPAKAGCSFEHTPLADGDLVAIDRLSISVLETPGHTPEHISFVVRDLSRGEEPAALFCGDTVFVGDTGRPDIFPATAAELAERLYQSIHEKILDLPDSCLLLPSHGAGSMCGRSIKAMPFSTVGYERLSSPLLSAKREDFVRVVTAGGPLVPDHFMRCGAVNAAGPALLSGLPDVPARPPDEFNTMMRAGALVLDTRSYDAFGGMHVPDSLSIDLDGNFSIMSGWVVPPSRDILLVLGESSRAGEATAGLRRVGLDSITGYLSGGMYAWARSGLPVSRVYQVSPGELPAILEDGEGWKLIDVRSPAEYAAFHLRAAVNIPFADLRTRAGELLPNKPTLVMCGSGRRSILGASILLRGGLKTVFNLAGGLPAALRSMKRPEGLFEGDPKSLAAN